MASSIVSQEDKISYGQGHELIQALVNRGITSNDIQRIIVNQDLAQKIVNLSVCSSKDIYIHTTYDDLLFDESESQLRARDIMGGSYVSVLDIVLGLGSFMEIKYTPEMLMRLEKIHYSDETLKRYKKTHILFPGCPLSIYDIMRRLNRRSLDFLDHESFIHKKVKLRWYLLRKSYLPGSLNKTYREQLDLLLAKEDFPYINELYLMATLWGWNRNQDLFSGCHVRCKDTDSKGRPVTFGKGTVAYERMMEIEKDPLLGIASVVY